MISVANPRSAIRNFTHRSSLIAHCSAVLAYLAGAALFTWPWLTEPGRYWEALLACVATGWGMFLLAGYLSGSRRAGFVAGFAFTFWGWHVARLVEWPAIVDPSDFGLLLGPLLYLFFLLRREGRLVVNTLGAGLALALTALADPELLLYTGIFTVGWALERGLDRRVPPVQRVRALGGAGSAWGIGLALAVVGALLNPQGGVIDYGPVNFWFQETIQMSARPLGYLAPGPLSTVFGGLLPAPTVSALAAMATAVFPGWSVWGLGGYGLIRVWPRTRLWAGVGLVGLVVSLGPRLEIFGVGVPLPYSLFYLLPGPLRFPFPVHFALLAQLALAVGLAFGLADLLRRLQGAERFELRPSRTEILEFRVPSVKPHLLFAAALLAITVEQLIIPLPPAP
jgi:hypothetical protein